MTTRLHAEIRGPVDGRALVLVHGLSSSWRIWTPVIEGLTSRFRVIALDLPGFGDSPSPERKWTLEEAADAVLLAARTAGACSFLLAGHSLGGGVAIALCLRHPEAVRGLVLVAPAGLVDTPLDAPTWRDRGLHRARRLAARVGLPLLGVSRLIRVRALGHLVFDPAALSASDAVAIAYGAPKAVSTVDARYAIHHAALLDAVSAIDIPSRIVWGADDLVVDPRWAPILADRLPQGELTLLDHVGHVPIWEAPVAVLGAIEEVAAATSSSS